MKYQILQQLKKNGIIAVVRGKNHTDAINISKNIIIGGVFSIELTFTTKTAQKAIYELSQLSQNYSNVIIGAGTVLDAITARVAILNGAKFIVSPGFDQEVAKLCNLYSIPYFPGCASPTEIIEAMKYGCEIIKLFPGNLLTAKYIKDMHGPLPNVEFIPSGGVDLNNVSEWVKNKAWAVSIGSFLSKGYLEKGEKVIVENTKAFVSKYQEALTQI